MISQSHRWRRSWGWPTTVQRYHSHYLCYDWTGSKHNLLPVCTASRQLCKPLEPERHCTWEAGYKGNDAGLPTLSCNCGLQNLSLFAAPFPQRHIQLHRPDTLQCQRSTHVHVLLKRREYRWFLRKLSYRSTYRDSRCSSFL